LDGRATRDLKGETIVTINYYSSIILLFSVASFRTALDGPEETDNNINLTTSHHSGAVCSTLAILQMNR
jgi:hypothetical protein